MKFQYNKFLVPNSMIILGEVQNYSTESMTIKTKEDSFKLVFNKENLENHQLNQNDSIVAYFPQTIQKKIIKSTSDNVSNIIEYSKIIKIARNPFGTISELKKDKYSDLIAICTDYKPLIKTKGTDYLFSLILMDISGNIELKVFIDEKSFKDLIKNGTDDFKKGDILLIRNVKRGFSANIAVVSKPCMISKIKDYENTNINFVENGIAKFLNNFYTNSTFSAPKKIKKIRDIADKSFFNILGKIIRYDIDQVPSVCITDFTINPLIEEGAGMFPNNMVLVIKLFGQHSALLQKVVVGKYFIFENIRIHSFNNMLEAYMHDNLPGDVVHVNKEEMLQEIKEEERRYYSRTRGDGTKTAKTYSMQSNNSTNGKENPFDVRIIPIHCIESPGVFLCSCLIEDVLHSLDKENQYSTITVIDSGKEYKIRTKRNLTLKMMGNNDILLRTEYKCLVLKTNVNELFLVDIFVKDEEYLNFIEFYSKSCKKE